MRTAEGAAPPPGAERNRGIAQAFAWGGALLFFVSLSFFLYSYAVTYGEVAGLPPEGGSYGVPGEHEGQPGRAARAVTIDIVLFSIFALHHSVFARERVRAWVSRVVPSHLERSWYVWVASTLFIAVCAWWQPVPGLAWRLEGIWHWGALAIQAAGIWLSVHSAAIIDIFELAGVRQLSPRQGPMEFKTSGPYGWVRHPIYSGWFLMVFAAPSMTMTRLVFAAISSAYLLIAIPFEERSLKRVAGEAYAEYSRRVRWKLLPGVY